MDERASRAPHLVTTAGLVDYELVVPTYRRWRSTQEALSFRWHFPLISHHFFLISMDFLVNFH